MKRIITVAAIIVVLTLLRALVIPGESLSNTPDTIDADVQTEQIESISDEGQLEDESSEGWEIVKGGLKQFYKYTGVRNATFGHIIMLVVGLFFIFLAIFWPPLSQKFSAGLTF